MFFGKRDKERLGKILGLLETEGSVVGLLERRVEELERQNKVLFDRLMARNWEQYSIYKGEEMGGAGDYLGELLPEEDEENAGEILELGEDK